MTLTTPVLLADPGPAHRGRLESLADHAHTLTGTGVEVLDLVGDHTPLFPRPGGGDTRILWEALATVAAVDLSAARVLEPHLDALAIIDEAGRANQTSPEATPLTSPAQSKAAQPAAVQPTPSWGVFAAEGPGGRLVAGHDDGRVMLTGRKPWCSLAGSLSHALVTAWVDEHQRGLYAVELTDPGVHVDDVAKWVARGLRAVPSGPVTFSDVPATPVGEPGWYLRRPGFAWGGMGVAAIWFGATVALARRVFAQAGTRPLDQIGQSHLGAIDAALTGARLVLRACADLVDQGRADGNDGSVAALRCRQIVARTAETVLWRSDHALGPGPLAFEGAHAARVADLHLYVCQEHAERDQAALGRALIAESDATPPW